MGKIRLAGLVVVAVVVVASVATPPPEYAVSGGFLEGAEIGPELRGKLERACRDCHSDEPRYPWYARVAPVSWWLGQHVREGRERLNFSRWKGESRVRKLRLLSDLANQVQIGEMPPKSYVWMHGEARLSEAEVEEIFKWSQGERGRVVGE